MAPIVGQQVTLTATNWSIASPRISLLMNRAAAGECDLVAKANFGGDEAGFLYDNSTGFITDRRGQQSVSLGYLRARATHTDSAVTFTCTPGPVCASLSTAMATAASMAMSGTSAAMASAPAAETTGHTSVPPLARFSRAELTHLFAFNSDETPGKLLQDSRCSERCAGGACPKRAEAAALRSVGETG